MVHGLSDVAYAKTDAPLFVHKVDDLVVQVVPAQGQERLGRSFAPQFVVAGAGRGNGSEEEREVPELEHVLHGREVVHEGREDFHQQALELVTRVDVFGRRRRRLGCVVRGSLVPVPGVADDALRRRWWYRGGLWRWRGLREVEEVMQAANQYGGQVGLHQGGDNGFGPLGEDPDDLKHE